MGDMHKVGCAVDHGYGCDCKPMAEWERELLAGRPAGITVKRSVESVTFEGEGLRDLRSFALNVIGEGLGGWVDEFAQKIIDATA